MKKSNNNLATLQTDAVRDAIAKLYRTFRHYSAPVDTLDVCIACCMDVKLEQEMRTRPLRTLYRSHFYEYNTSAKGNVQPADEVKYFVPRMCELLVEGADIHHSVELYLDRLGRCPLGSLSSDEREALDAFALEFFAAGLRQPLYEKGGLFHCDDAMTILLMFDIGGLDIDPLLKHWQTDCEANSVIHFAQMAYWDFWYYGGVVSNAFADRRPEFKQKMEAWMTSAEVRNLFASRMLELATSASTEVLATKYACCRTIETLLDDAYQYVAP